MPSNDERFERDVGAQPQRVAPGVQVHRSVDHADRPILVLVLRGADERHVAQRSVQRARGLESTRHDDRRREPADGAEVHVRLAHGEIPKRQALAPA